MNSDMIRKELIQLDMVVTDTDEFFEIMSKKLMALGYVTATFTAAIKKREAEFPTALPIYPFAVAIPHTSCEHIKRPFIAPIRLKNTIKWCEMAANDVVHDVKFVFMLGIKEAHQQVDLLQVMVNNFQHEQLMRQLEEVRTEEEYYKLLMTMEGLVKE